MINLLKNRLLQLRNFFKAGFFSLKKFKNRLLQLKNFLKIRLLELKNIFKKQAFAI